MKTKKQQNAIDETLIGLVNKNLGSDWKLEFENESSSREFCGSYIENKTVWLDYFFYSTCTDNDSIIDVLLHEIAHIMVGYRYGHNEEWRNCFTDIGGSGSIGRVVGQEQVLKLILGQLISKHLTNSWSLEFDSINGNVGNCNCADRVISIDKQFLSYATNKQILDSLLHEIAHALTISKYKHGRAWKEICVIIGCSGIKNIKCGYDKNGIPKYYECYRKLKIPNLNNDGYFLW